ncbi:MAG TPA: Fe-S cluster assembly protein NifU [bacterium]|nr:Fe-S cluster assembly protein NifU [bacterium]HOL48522.1 Fe-S cluster assembly protein NifU [bacterium]HPQ19702.1 Fe-S cluster assembly protein NifU [bacterium]
MWDYTEKVKEHFLNPRNSGKIDDANAIGEVGNISCGDALKLYLKIDDKTKKIIDAKFQTFGCASAIASSSVLTELIIGKTIEEAEKITNNDIAEYLGGLPPEKMHCSVMGMEALQEAIKNYRGEKKEKEVQEKIICKCFNISEEKILKAIKENNLKTVDDVTHYTKAGGACGKCKPDIQVIIDNYYNSLKEPPPKKKLTTIQKINLIQQTIENEIKPLLRVDGGDLELYDIDNNKVIIKLRGTCSNCISANFTLKGFIEKKLREIVDNDLIVEEIK